MINDNELQEIKGGAKWKYVSLGAGVIISFIIGVIDGYLRPRSC